MSLRTLSTVALAAAALILPSLSHATVIRLLDLETLAQQSDAIVCGTARSTAARASPDGKLINTVATVEIASAIKGEPPQVIEVRTPGGTIGELTQMVVGGPQFTTGEEVVLFLKRPLPGGRYYTLHGFTQGKFQVRRDADGVRRVHQEVQGLAAMGADGQVQPVPEFEPVPEQAFLERVRRAVQEKAAP